jgi:5-methyltetrahydrofolate--homocysteine methyltransferase
MKKVLILGLATQILIILLYLTGLILFPFGGEYWETLHIFSYSGVFVVFFYVFMEPKLYKFLFAIIATVLAVINVFFLIGYTLLLMLGLLYLKLKKGVNEGVVVKGEYLNRKLALQFLGVRGETPPDIAELLDKYESLFVDVVSSRAVHGIFEAGIVWKIQRGSDIKTHLEGCDKIIILAATLGLQVDELIRQTEAADMAGAVVLDALASAAIEQVCDLAEADIRAEHSEITARFSPGYGDFPLEVQSELLGLLNAKKKIGLYVNKSNLLIPRKSVTAVIGVKK